MVVLKNWVGDKHHINRKICRFAVNVYLKFLLYKGYVYHAMIGYLII